LALGSNSGHYTFPAALKFFWTCVALKLMDDDDDDDDDIATLGMQ